MPAPPELSEPAIVRAIGVAPSDCLIGRAPSFRISVCSRCGVNHSSMRANRHVLDQPLPEPVERTGQDQQARQDQQHTHHHLDAAQMASEALQEGDERADGQRRQDEGNAEAKRIDEQQAHARAEAASFAASVNTVASTGPMQGVQPKAKARPMRKAPARLAPRISRWMRAWR